MIKFSIYLSFTVHYNNTKIGGSTQILSITIVLSCFHQLISYYEKIVNLIITFAANEKLNLSNF